MNRIALLMAFALFLGACASAPTLPPVVTAPSIAGNPCDGPERRSGKTEASLRQVFGEPLNRAVRTMPNRHDPSITDRRVTLVFDGALAELHEVPKYDASFLARLELTSSRADVMPSLRVGMKRSDAMEALGMGRARPAPFVTKECPWAVPPSIEVHFRGDRVSRIIWTNEPD